MSFSGKTEWRVPLSLGIAMLGWGWAWVGIRSAVRHFDPGALALARYLVASLVLWPLWRRQGGRWPRLAEWPLFALMGLLGFTFYNLCINAGEHSIAAGTAALIAASIPVMLTVGGWLLFGERLSAGRWCGIALSLGGVALLTLGAEDGAWRLSSGALWVLLAAGCAAAYGLLNKRAVGRQRPLDVTTWAIWAGTLGLLPFGAGLPAAWSAAPAGARWTVVLLGAVPGALCYALWTESMTRTSLARVSSWMFLIPVFALILGWVLLAEAPPPLALAGGLATLAGVALVNRPQS